LRKFYAFLIGMEHKIWWISNLTWNLWYNYVITEMGKPVISRCNHNFGESTEYNLISQKFQVGQLW
jgi:hypothetical protein